MALEDKGPIRLVILLGNQSLGKTPDYTEKIRSIVEFTAVKIAELFLSVREDYEFRGFEISSHHCHITEFQEKMREIRSDHRDIILGFSVGSYHELSSKNADFDNYFLVPEKLMQVLPLDSTEEKIHVKEVKNILDELFCHLVREIFHSLGAFHSDNGVMSGYPHLLTGEYAEDVKLVEHTDQKTINIICESLSIITTLAPQRDLKYFPGIQRLLYETDQSISAVFFVKNEKYTTTYQQFTLLDACKKYTVSAPAEWDGFVIVHFCGHIFHYTKKDVLTTKRCSKKKLF